MKDRRILQGGTGLSYTCENDRFLTDLTKGFSHGSYGPAKGSVTKNRLADSAGWTVWLEHVSDKTDPSTPYYWLMWYNPDGLPTIPLSAVFTHDDLMEMMKELMQYVPK